MDSLGQQGIGFVSLTQEWANTTSPMRTFLFRVFGGLAELGHRWIGSEQDPAYARIARERTANAI